MHSTTPSYCVKTMLPTLTCSFPHAVLHDNSSFKKKASGFGHWLLSCCLNSPVKAERAVVCTEQCIIPRDSQLSHFKSAGRTKDIVTVLARNEMVDYLILNHRLSHPSAHLL